MGRLMGYFQPERIDSEGQLKAAQSAAGNYTKEQDAQAKAAGFRNANEMLLFLKARQQGSRVQGSAGKAPSVNDAMSWHPKNTIQRASDQLRSATKRR